MTTGIRAVAIAGLHAYLNPVHEARVAEIAARSALPRSRSRATGLAAGKLVGRGDTTVVDAYLSPILRRYVDQVADALDLGRACDWLYFMQSNGGLTDARCSRARTRSCRGPRAASSAWSRPARTRGFDRLIGFDMGGTSTDVCHYAGLRAQLRDRGRGRADARADDAYPHGRGRRRLDPASSRMAASRSAPKAPAPIPGRPATAGGPLTVTDCNVMLGKLHPAHFPAVFGPKADEPLDAGRRAPRNSRRLRASRPRRPASRRTPEEMAEGFLRIAVENMANAIKKISVQRGYDVTRYTLQVSAARAGSMPASSPMRWA
jgi:5-oxoprolinase (ATP-hydrolysing)